jgi:outer membrane biosynthesis protein TonB
VAVQKNNNRKTDKDTAPKKPIGVIFWLAFFILIIGLFLFNRDRIKQTLENTQILTHLSLPSEKSKDPVKSPEEKNPPVEDAPKSAPAVTKTETKPAASARETPAPVKPADKPPAPPEKPAASTPAVQPAAPVTPPASQPQAGRQPTTPVPASPAPAASGNSRPAAGDRERTIYFTQVDSAGTILRTKVTRRIPASDSPMVDSLQALLGGPNAEEQRRGMVSLIPAGIKILNATVRGNTAYISFSEEFQYNTYGVEGYAAQLKQIIWTATEFSNVKDVQILIEGNRVDYLGEGIWIGSPLGRESFD